MTGRLPTESDLELLKSDFGGIIACDVDLSAISHWRIGGTADAVLRPRSVDELRRIRAWLHERGITHLVIGATSNLLFADEGLRAVVIQLGSGFRSVTFNDDMVSAGAATWVPGLARLAMKAGLTGLEHTCGIPGTLGGLVYMNGGSKRLSIGRHVREVVSVDIRGCLVRRKGEDCRFEYRTSVFQGLQEVIAEVRLGPFEPRPRREIRREMLQILHERSRKFPRKLPNCGSVFMSNPEMYVEHGPPGAVLERLGFKGKRVGAAQFSLVHANFINNLGGASASDVLTLIEDAKQAVHHSTGFALEVEARYVSESGVITPAG